jgi:hypothetical protein
MRIVFEETPLEEAASSEIADEERRFAGRRLDANWEQAKPL